VLIKNGRVKEKKIIQEIGQATALDLKYKLSFETWDSVFSDNDINTMYNYFLHSLLRIFYSSFPLKELIIKVNNNSWITPGIKEIFTYYIGIVMMRS
jgi:predicted component of viral defense system (DUF524 family)